MSFILDIKPNVVSRDLSGLVVAIYGNPKSGKTTTACSFKKPLLLGYEKGYSSIPGIHAMPMNSWADTIKVERELKKPDVKQAFETIIIDTADLAYEQAERHILQLKGVQTIGTIPHGAGYKMVYDLFHNFITNIAKMGYGVVIISHSKDKKEVVDGVEYTKKVPTLSSKAMLVFERTADIYGYIGQQSTGEVDELGAPKYKSVLFMRETPYYAAGCRNEYMPHACELNYDALVKAVAEAVDKMDPSLTTAEKINHYDNGLKMEDLQAELKVVKDELVSRPNAKELVPVMVEIIARHLGEGIKVTDVAEGQESAVASIIEELKQL